MEQSATVVKDFVDEVRISFFGNLFEKETGKTLTVGELLRGIQNCEWGREIAHVRQVLAQQGQDAYKIAKRNLPAVTVSGVIHGHRKSSADEGRIDHSGILQIDFDGKDHPGLSVGEIQARCKVSPYLLAMFMSPSGDGLKCLARCEADLDQHLNSFLAAEKHFSELGLVIDPATKDASRLMIVCSDPDIWVNPLLPPVLPPLDDDDGAATERRGKGCPADQQKQQHISPSIAEVRTVLFQIPKRPPYERWIRVSWAVVNTLGKEAGIELLKEWSPEETPGEYSRLCSGKVPEDKGAARGHL